MCVCLKLPGMTSIGHYGPNKGFEEGYVNVSAQSLTLNREYTLLNVLKALASIISMCNLRLERKDTISMVKCFENSNFDSLCSKLECHVVSKAFLMSKNTFWIEIKGHVFRQPHTLYVVLWRARKTNWLALSWPLSSICLWRNFKNTFSNSFPVVDRRLIERKFLRNFGSLPGLGKVITLLLSK